MNIAPLSSFNDNYIWVLSQETPTCTVVDPGDARPVIEWLETHHITLDSILITHHHHDHIGGVSELCKRYQPRVYGPASTNLAEITDRVREGDIFTLDHLNTSFSVLEIPGHTLDHIAFICMDPAVEPRDDNTSSRDDNIAPSFPAKAGNPGVLCTPTPKGRLDPAVEPRDGNTSSQDDKTAENSDTPLLFCGDTLFAAGCGRVFEGSPEMMYHSLSKLAKLPPKTRVYCAHEYTRHNLQFAKRVEPQNPAIHRRLEAVERLRNKNLPTLPSILAEELETNPFLRCKEPSIIDAIFQQRQQAPKSAVEIFAALREWKDRF